MSKEELDQATLFRCALSHVTNCEKDFLKAVSKVAKNPWHVVPMILDWLHLRGTWSIHAVDGNPSGKIAVQFSSEADNHFTDSSAWGDDTPTALARLVLNVSALEEERDIFDLIGTKIL